MSGMFIILPNNILFESDGGDDAGRTGVGQCQQR